MVEILKNSTNEVILTLKEKVTLQNPNYLFQFTNEMSGYEIIFVASGDTSTYPSRYNQFFITEDIISNQNLYNGIINLPNTGFYAYKIYETIATIPQNLSISATTSLLEEGRIEVIDITTTGNTYFDQTWVKNDIVFNG